MFVWEKAVGWGADRRGAGQDCLFMRWFLLSSRSEGSQAALLFVTNEQHERVWERKEVHRTEAATNETD